MLASVAHFLPPASYHNSFRPNGVPFAFYREAGLVEDTGVGSNSTSPQGVAKNQRCSSAMSTPSADLKYHGSQRQQQCRFAPYSGSFGLLPKHRIQR